MILVKTYENNYNSIKDDLLMKGNFWYIINIRDVNIDIREVLCYT
jgi:hypothetical protein